DSIRLEQKRIRKIEIAMRDFKESTIETHYNVTISFRTLAKWTWAISILGYTAEKEDSYLFCNISSPFASILCNFSISK
ncbi:MAG: hypothetical protein E7E54_09305, partial [Varibaculum cambriense]|uniref:hypothetical protein n=1 Tax=Varibaculum cambriense TaxID=184870 RepID=UPI0028FF6A41